MSDIYNEAKRVYLIEKVKPYKLSKTVYALRKRLREFASTNVEFLAEVPSVRALLCEHADDCNNISQRHYHSS
jgi:hypothetical protein